MTVSQSLVANLSALLMAAAAAGLLARRRARLCWSFLAYLVALILGNQLTVWFPDTFHSPGFWIAKTVVYDALLSLIALEIALLAFSGLPRARLRAEMMLALILLVFLGIGMLPTTSVGYPYLAMLGLVAPRGTAACLWLFVAVMGIAVWHRAPMHPFHRALLLAFSLYLGMETWLLGLVGIAAASRPAYMAAYAYLEALDPLAFAVTAGFWAWAAWRREPKAVLSPAVAHRLQPWAAQC